MAILKCKMCGGDIELSQDKTFGTCEYCGSTMTFPKVSDDQRAAAFNRGNHFRRIGEFDKALAVYERIVREDDADAEAHWCCALCRFGIEYVEDPTSFEWLPTCHRASFDSFLEDVDYLAAVEHSDGITRRQYQKDAAKIAEVQRGILATSQNSEPYDVFICYKESDENGNRTRDSLLAQDIYYQLAEQGRKVFFSRITLEDMVGTQYEPYIFAALNSAKVMIVVGTKAEYMNAVWVKNEWSRFLAMMKKDRSKILLPCYRDMDPYDMPEQLSVLQSYDMGKIGFIQDLIRGIAKVLDAQKQPEVVKEVAKETVVVQQAAPTSTAPLLQRAFMFLEDGEWNSANEYCEKVLDLEPQNAMAYMGKLMADLRVKKQELLKDRAEPFDDKNNYQKAVRFASEELKATLVGYIEHINTRNENARLEGIYNKAKVAMQSAKVESDYQLAEREFRSILFYKDSEALANQCAEKAEVARKNEIYDNAQTFAKFDDCSKIDRAIRLFESILGWKDADEKIVACKEKMEEIQVRQEAARKNEIYDNAQAFAKFDDCSKIDRAIHLFESISGWKDADEKIVACKKKMEEIRARQEADRLERERKAMLAREEAERIAKRNKKIAILIGLVLCATIAFVIALKIVIIPTVKYNKAIALMNAGNVVEAYEALTALDGYKDSAEKANSIFPQYKAEKLKVAKVGDYVFFGEYEQDNDTSNGKEKIEWLVLEVKDGKVLVISKYALDFALYNTSNDSVTWETCSARKWLNKEFLNAAFSAEEKAMIPTVIVSADKNPNYSTDPGSATRDKVFLLSISEAEMYFDSASARVCKPTAYAVAKGVHAYNTGNCQYWLRSPGRYEKYAACILDMGSVSLYGDAAISYGNAIRPAIWIDLSML